MDNDIKEITYNEALAEIDKIVLRIENETLDVDDLSEDVKKVSSLIKLCRNKLLKTREDVESILSETTNA